MERGGLGGSQQGDEFPEFGALLEGHRACDDGVGAGLSEFGGDEPARFLHDLFVAQWIFRRALGKGDVAFEFAPILEKHAQRGLIAGVELVRDKATREPFDWAERVGHRVSRAARERGVLTRPLGNVVVIMPPLSVTVEELDEIMDAIAAGLSLVK